MLLIILPDLPTEDTLLEQANHGNQGAMVQIYEIFFEPVYRYIRLRVDDPMTAEDIASEVFTALITSFGTSKAPRHTLRGWLFQVARNLLQNHRGSVQNAPKVELHDWISAPNENQPDIQFAHKAQAEQVRQAITRLPDEQQEVLLLRFSQALTLQETADIMGKNVNTIKSLQFRAIETLRRMLEKQV